MLTDPISFANHAAQQSDRWLLIVILVLVCAGAAWLMKFLINRNEEVARKSEERYEAQIKRSEERIERHVTLLEGLFKQANASTERVASVISENTTVVSEYGEQMKEATERIRKCDVTLERASLIIDRFNN